MGCGASRSTSCSAADVSSPRYSGQSREAMDKKEEGDDDSSGTAATATPEKKPFKRQQTPFSIPIESIPKDVGKSTATKSEVKPVSSTTPESKVIGGTESEIEFFRNLDKRIQAGKDYNPDKDSVYKRFSDYK